MTTLIAPIAGPILGGYISDNFHWGWIFLINVPVGLFCAFVCWRVMAKRETPTRKLPIDTIGVAMLIVWVGALQDRKRVVEGKSVSVRVDLGGRRIIKKKNNTQKQ